MEKSKFQFSNPEILAMEFYKEENYNGPSTLEVNNSFYTSHKILAHNEAYVKLSVKVEAENGLFGIIVKMGALFNWDEVDNETVTMLLTKNAPAMLLAYIRPVITNVLTGAGFNTYVLPLIDFTKGEDIKCEVER